jgi:hypothetical protein
MEEMGGGGRLSKGRSSYIPLIQSLRYLQKETTCQMMSLEKDNYEAYEKFNKTQILHIYIYIYI